MKHRPSWRLQAGLYPFGWGAVAVNLFFASLITQSLGWRALTPYEAMVWAVPLALPVGWWFGTHIMRLIAEAEKR
ncbi:NnrU [Roseobacter sp. SK209-2-6]|uniref:hypothetical protein n=1 Tax=Roseobacter sp. SK209-2-6 TaxID=388739 RepID=UPI0000F3ECC9|nr:hypothetical protein [Roseobacter sp. SK209-2-6]EBA16882.1 NnrU [Roseobacter sp. SK209-2-6]